MDLSSYHPNLPIFILPTQGEGDQDLGKRRQQIENQ
jgi:hypothetical protein